MQNQQTNFQENVLGKWSEPSSFPSSFSSLIENDWNLDTTDLGSFLNFELNPNSLSGLEQAPFEISSNGTSSFSSTSSFSPDSNPSPQHSSSSPFCPHNDFKIISAPDSYPPSFSQPQPNPQISPTPRFVPIKQDVHSPEEIPTTEDPHTKVKKRRVVRGHVSSLACESCRSKHIKCSGEPNGCASCLKHNLICKYPEVDNRKKRKTYQEKTEQLEALVVALSQKVSPPTNDLATSTELQTFLTSFQEHVEPFFGIKLSFVPSDASTKFNDLNPQQKFLFFNMVAAGAVAIGYSDFAEKYTTTSRELLPLIFDSTSKCVAAGYSLMGYFYTRKGDEERCQSCTVLSRSMLQRLSEKSPQDASLKEIMYGTSLNILKSLKTSEQRLELVNQMAKDLESSLDIPLETLSVYRSLGAFLRIFMLILSESRVDAPTLHKMVDFMDSCLVYLPIKQGKQISLISRAARALIFFFEKNFEASKLYAGRVSEELLEIKNYHFPGLVFALNVSTLINHKLGSTQYLQMNITSLYTLQKIFPVISHVFGLAFGKMNLECSCRLCKELGSRILEIK